MPNLSDVALSMKREAEMELLKIQITLKLLKKEELRGNSVGKNTRMEQDMLTKERMLKRTIADLDAIHNEEKAKKDDVAAV